jgi:hypothetical protein
MSVRTKVATQQKILIRKKKLDITDMYPAQVMTRRLNSSKISQFSGSIIGTIANFKRLAIVPLN